MCFPFLKLYRFATWAANPLLPLWLKLRLYNGKEDKRRFREKLGKAAFSRPQNSLIWIHAASVGEANAVLPLIEKISQAYPKLNILITTVTLSSAKLLANKLPERAFHQFVPFDSPQIIKRFLEHWQPSMALFVESEIWPNMIRQTRNSGCKLLLINARLSRRSFEKWRKIPEQTVNLLDNFDRIYPQNEQSAELFKSLGVNDIRQMGNLKYDAPALPADSKAAGEIIQQISGRPCWLAASTHEGEELIAGEVHRILKELHPDLLTLIVPRHPKRSADIKSQLDALGLKTVLRSSSEMIDSETDIYIADSFGELGIFYRVVGIVLMGGSMVPHGGQNPLEAARLDCALIFGPHMDNFPAITADFVRGNACINVKTAEQLQQTVEELLYNADRQEALANAAYEVVQQQGGCLERLLADLKSDLEVISPLVSSTSHTDENA